ncbi:MAG: N-acetylmuramoyl-L-alanine amidase [Saprospiraceae bacterium]|nr:N-acetylmuramoyl-L-alanine amidase [Saprospiraceae bacterium]
MFRKLFFSLAFISFALSVMANAPSFHEVSPKKGEGIYALMRKYDLNIHPCNLKKFLELNQLTKSDILKTGKKYKLPIYLYTYNGKSIRSTIEDYNMEKALRIKKYNEKILKNGHRRKSFVTSKILWVPYHEIGCNLPSTKEDNLSSEVIDKNSLYVSLFGDKYGKVKVEDFSLKNKVYYVVAGHGGPDPGAMCNDCPKDMCEDEYAYDIALRLARDLMQHGAKVHVIIQDPNDGIRDEKYLKCDYDEKCMGKLKIPRRQKARLVQRSAEINKLYRSYKAKGIKYEDQVAIFLHVDSNSESKQQDVFFYHHKKSKTGKKLVKKIRDTFDKKYAQYQKGRGYKGTVKSRGLYVINYTQPTAVFVELANIRNRNDHKRLILNTNRQAIANWLFEGLTK